MIVRFGDLGLLISHSLAVVCLIDVLPQGLPLDHLCEHEENLFPVKQTPSSNKSLQFLRSLKLATGNLGTIFWVIWYALPVTSLPLRRFSRRRASWRQPMQFSSIDHHVVTS